MIKIESENEFRQKIKGKVLIDFYADWCGPCKMLEKVLESIDEDKIIEIIQVNTDKFPNLAREYKIMTIPNLKLVENNKIIRELRGLVSRDELLSFIEGEKI